MKNSTKINVLTRAAETILDGTQEFSCCAVEHAAMKARCRSINYYNWYSELSARLHGKTIPHLFVRDFTPYNYGDEAAPLREQAKNERALWLAMLATLIEENIEKNL